MLRIGKKDEHLLQAETALAECCAHLHLPLRSFSGSAREYIRRRSWSGGEAELRRAVYAAALIASGTTVDAVHFPPRARVDHEALAHAHFEDLALETMAEQKLAHFFERIGHYEVEGLHAAVLAQVERPLIACTLQWAGGNQLKAARALGINRNTLRRRMYELGMR